MQVRSLGYRTDLIFPAFDGEITDRGGYRIVRTPSNPGFYWGNFLLFRDPPGPGDHTRWPELFIREIGAPPAVRHQTFGWDSISDAGGDTREFLERGFRVARSSVLTAESIQPPEKIPDRVVVRPLESDDDWREALELQVACREPEFTEAGYREFRARGIIRYRAMIRAGLGAWYGAFLAGRLVADLGVFHDHSVGRYQEVETHPEFRRRGIAGTLVRFAGRHALDAFNLQTLVIVAEAGEPPAHLYESVGFRQTEFQMGLEKWPEMGAT